MAESGVPCPPVSLGLGSLCAFPGPGIIRAPESRATLEVNVVLAGGSVTCPRSSSSWGEVSKPESTRPVCNVVGLH